MNADNADNKRSPDLSIGLLFQDILSAKIRVYPWLN